MTADRRELEVIAERGALVVLRMRCVGFLVAHRTRFLWTL
jgi:hypothetical protein